MTPEQDIKRLFREEWSIHRAFALLFIVIAVIAFFTTGKYVAFNLLCAIVFEMKHDIEKLKRSQP